MTQQEDPQLLDLLISVFAGGGAVFQVTPGTGAIELLGGGLAVPEFRNCPTLRSALRCLSAEEVGRLLVAWREAERFRRSRLVHRIHLPDSSGGRWYQLRLAIDWGDDGPRRILGWLSDITMSQVAAEERDKLFQLSTDMLCVLGPDGYFRRFNDSWTRHLGLTPLTLITQPLAHLISEEDRDRFTSALADSLASGEAIADLEVTLERPGGSPLAVSWSSVVSDGRCYGIARDITERRRQAAQLEEANRRLSADLRRDGLTGLANTRLLKEYLGSALPRAGRRGECLAVVFVDLDGFKPVNDRFGHAAGDDVLREVANRLIGGIRGGDIAARIGGDEFVVVLEALSDREVAEDLAARLKTKVEAPMMLGQEHIAVSASFGLAMFPGDGVSAEELLAIADKEMYRAKRGH